MSKICGTDLIRIWNRNLNHLEQKSEPNLCEILEKYAHAPQNPDFHGISNTANQISVRNLDILAQISIKFGNEIDQTFVRNIFEIWSKFIRHADLHKNESTSVNGRKCVLKCVRESA